MSVQRSILNLSSFSSSQLQVLLSAAQDEVLRRITGRVQQGSSTGQSYSMALYSPEDLNALINSITAALGLDTEMTFVRPNFSHPTSNTGGWGSTGIPSNP